MSKDLARFCTSENRSHPVSVDPTFNFGKFKVAPFFITIILTSTCF